MVENYSRKEMKDLARKLSHNTEEIPKDLLGVRERLDNWLFTNGNSLPESRLTEVTKQYMEKTKMVALAEEIDFSFGKEYNKK